MIVTAGYINLNSGQNWNISTSYNGISSRTVWVDNKGSSAAAMPISSVQLCTKVSGVDTFKFTTTANHSGFSEVSHDIVVFRV